MVMMAMMSLESRYKARFKSVAEFPNLKKEYQGEKGEKERRKKKR